MATSNTPWQVLQALQAQFARIRKADGYNTDIGAKIFLYDQQRSETARPSIAIGTRAGVLNRTQEQGPDGRKVSERARSMSFTIEAAVASKPEDVERVAQDMLEDIETAWAVKVPGAPFNLGGVSLDRWEVIDSPAGINAAVLAIAGTASYIRN